MYKPKKKKVLSDSDITYLNKIKKNPTIQCDDCWWYITPMDWNCSGICIRCLSRRIQAFLFNGWDLDELSDIARGV